MSAIHHLPPAAPGIEAACKSFAVPDRVSLRVSATLARECHCLGV